MPIIEKDKCAAFKISVKESYHSIYTIIRKISDQERLHTFSAFSCWVRDYCQICQILGRTSVTFKISVRESDVIKNIPGRPECLAQIT